MKLPATIYTVYFDFGRLGIGHCGEEFEDLGLQLDAIFDSLKPDDDPLRMCRIFRTDFDVETGEVECHRDVTEDAINERLALLAERGAA